MRFHVVGVGGIGSLVAHHLRRATSTAHSIVLLYTKTKHANHGPDGLHVQSFGSVVPASGFERETFTANDDPIESLFVTTRANATLHALRELAPRLNANSTVVLVHNGLAVYDRVVEELFPNSIRRPHFIFASTTHVSSFRTAGQLNGDPYKVILPGQGTFEFGIVPDPFGRNFEAGFTDATHSSSEDDSRLSYLANPQEESYQRYRSLRNTVAALMMTDTLSVRWKPMEHLQLVLRQDLAVNSAIQPLTALLNCRTADIFDAPSSMRIASRICEEASAVFGAQIREQTKAWIHAGYGQIGSALGIARLSPALEAEALVKNCVRTSRNSKAALSNMLDSVRRGRATEIEFLNGYMVKLGKVYGVPTPTIETMYDLVEMRTRVPVDLIS
ncbi:putative 2-dehydropantoate 2-reductase [Favolaschia claudopus]|uniref:2-dehydropantoate 2-reductase n=1 Tax=Favolaschia claudopus TaxID=2862362 RepID=A0AAW0EGM4_9AGAR